MKKIGIGGVLAATTGVLHLAYRDVGLAGLNEVCAGAFLVLSVVYLLNRWDPYTIVPSGFFTWTGAAYGVLFLGLRFESARAEELLVTRGYVPWAFGIWLLLVLVGCFIPPVQPKKQLTEPADAVR